MAKTQDEINLIRHNHTQSIKALHDKVVATLALLTTEYDQLLAIKGNIAADPDLDASAEEYVDAKIAQMIAAVAAKTVGP